MTFLIHWLDNRREAIARSLDRGATLVEYALVVSLLLVGSLAAIDRVTEATSDEIGNQADCIETRPPRPECQLSPVLPTTTTVPPPTSTPTPPDEAPPQPYLSEFVYEWTADGTALVLTTMVEVAEPAEVTVGEPVLGAVVMVEFRMFSGPPYEEVGWFNETCTTDDTGTCSISLFTDPSVTRVEVQYQNINTPAFSIEDLPDEFTVDR